MKLFHVTISRTFFVQKKVYIHVHTSILLGRCICDIIWDSNWWSAAEVDTGCGYEFGSSSELFCCCGCIKYSPRLRAACLCFSVVLPGWRTRFLWRFSEDFCPDALADFPGWKKLKIYIVKHFLFLKNWEPYFVEVRCSKFLEHKDKKQRCYYIYLLLGHLKSISRNVCEIHDEYKSISRNF